MRRKPIARSQRSTLRTRSRPRRCEGSPVLKEFHYCSMRVTFEKSGDESPPSKALRNLSFGLLLFIGCATHADRLRDVRTDFYAGDLDHSAQAIDKQLRNKHDVDVFKLDRAMVQLAAGKPRECESLLREVRDRFDYLE